MNLTERQQQILIQRFALVPDLVNLQQIRFRSINLQIAAGECTNPAFSHYHFACLRGNVIMHFHKRRHIH